jgi:hypothetical protein
MNQRCVPAHYALTAARDLAHDSIGANLGGGASGSPGPRWGGGGWIVSSWSLGITPGSNQTGAILATALGATDPRLYPFSRPSAVARLASVWPSRVARTLVR